LHSKTRFWRSYFFAFHLADLPLYYSVRTDKVRPGKTESFSAGQSGNPKERKNATLQRDYYLPAGAISLVLFPSWGKSADDGMQFVRFA
jgi:hypothetical protein